jgi:hypothetical protein
MWQNIVYSITSVVSSPPPPQVDKYSSVQEIKIYLNTWNYGLKFVRYFETKY